MELVLLLGPTPHEELPEVLLPLHSLPEMVRIASIDFHLCKPFWPSFEHRRQLQLHKYAQYSLLHAATIQHSFRYDRPVCGLSAAFINITTTTLIAIIADLTLHAATIQKSFLYDWVLSAIRDTCSLSAASASVTNIAVIAIIVDLAATFAAAAAAAHFFFPQGLLVALIAGWS